MVADSIPSPVGEPSRAFAEPLRKLPRRVRLPLLMVYRVAVSFVRHDGLTWAASMAFWLTLSVPPLLIGLSSMAMALFGQEAVRQVLAEQVAAQLPAQGSIIRDIVQQEIPLTSLAGVGSLVLLLFSGSRVFGALISAVNAMWSHVENTSFLRRQLLRIAMVLFVGGMLLVSTVLQLGVLGARDEIGLPADLLARYILPLGLVIGGLWLTYFVIPRGKATWGTALLAAVVTALLLRAAQVAFWWFLNNMVDFSQSYGPLAGVAILMTWAVVASAILLIGAELVAVLDRHKIDQVPLPSSAKGDPDQRSMAD